MKIRDTGADALERQESLRQVRAKLNRGASQAERGELADGDAVFEALRELIEERRRANVESARL